LALFDLKKLGVCHEANPQRRNDEQPPGLD